MTEAAPTFQAAVADLPSVQAACEAGRTLSLRHYLCGEERFADLDAFHRQVRQRRCDFPSSQGHACAGLYFLDAAATCTARTAYTAGLRIVGARQPAAMMLPLRISQCEQRPAPAAAPYPTDSGLQPPLLLRCRNRTAPPRAVPTKCPYLTSAASTAHNCIVPQGMDGFVVIPLLLGNCDLGALMLLAPTSGLLDRPLLRLAHDLAGQLAQVLYAKACSDEVGASLASHANVACCSWAACSFTCCLLCHGSLWRSLLTLLRLSPGGSWC